MLSALELSSICGYASIACWIIVYTPQIVENYQLKSGEGLSVAFIVLWLIGDLTNLAGGAMVGLIPSLVLLAVWYTVCDIILLFQVYWYRRKTAEAASASAISVGETQPLVGKPAAAQAAPKTWAVRASQFGAELALVVGAGLVAWWVTADGEGHGGGEGSPVDLPAVIEWKSQTLGWISAATYIGSRVPQIVHNHKTRCAGLSLDMFFFSITGNVTYVASILFKSVQRRYILANLPWLCGSGLTVFLDIIVLSQFVYFSRQPQPLLLAADDEARE